MWNVRRHEDVVARGGDNPDLLVTVVEHELGVSAPDEDRRLGLTVVMVVRLPVC